MEATKSNYQLLSDAYNLLKEQYMGLKKDFDLKKRQFKLQNQKLKELKNQLLQFKEHICKQQKEKLQLEKSHQMYKKESKLLFEFQEYCYPELYQQNQDKVEKYVQFRCELEHLNETCTHQRERLEKTQAQNQRLVKTSKQQIILINKYKKELENVHNIYLCQQQNIKKRNEEKIEKYKCQKHEQEILHKSTIAQYRCELEKIENMEYHKELEDLKCQNCELQKLNNMNKEHLQSECEEIHQIYKQQEEKMQIKHEDEIREYQQKLDHVHQTYQQQGHKNQTKNKECQGYEIGNPNKKYNQDEIQQIQMKHQEKIHKLQSELKNVKMTYKQYELQILAKKERGLSPPKLVIQTQNIYSKVQGQSNFFNPQNFQIQRQQPYIRTQPPIQQRTSNFISRLPLKVNTLKSMITYPNKHHKTFTQYNLIPTPRRTLNKQWQNLNIKTIITPNQQTKQHFDQYLENQYVKRQHVKRQNVGHQHLPI